MHLHIKYDCVATLTTQVDDLPELSKYTIIFNVQVHCMHPMIGGPMFLAWWESSYAGELSAVVCLSTSMVL